jgi:hypothetical protein
VALADLTLYLTRLDDGELILDGAGLVHQFFKVDRSSVGIGAYDSLAGQGNADRIETIDIEALNRTMRARSSHAHWIELTSGPLPWLSAIPGDLDLIATDEQRWVGSGADPLVRAAIRYTVGSGRGVSVATKMLHLKRPRLFPVLDGLVAELLGRPITARDPAKRADQATSLVLHLRREGRRNADALCAIRNELANHGMERSLVRVLDAALWLSHPAAGVKGVRRRFEVGLVD